MTPQRIRFVRSLFGALLLVCFAVGCGSGVPSNITMPEGKQHILHAANAWTEYKRANKKEPASINDLKDWTKKQKPDLLSRMGITDPDKAFVSPRDNELYGLVSPGKNNPMGLGTVIYETKGIGGVHLTASNMGSSGEMTDEQLQDTISSAGKSKK